MIEEKKSFFLSLDQELEIVERVKENKTISEICKDLGISPLKVVEILKEYNSKIVDIEKVKNRERMIELREYLIEGIKEKIEETGEMQEVSNLINSMTKVCAEIQKSILPQTNIQNVNIFSPQLVTEFATSDGTVRRLIRTNKDDEPIKMEVISQ